MISDGCDLGQFVEAVKDRDILDIIRLADREALEAWRRAYHTVGANEPDRQRVLRYTDILESLIDFMRYGVKPPGLTKSESDWFQYLCSSATERSLGPTRC